MQGIRCLETEVNKGCLLLKTRWLTVWCGDWFNSYKHSCIYTSIYIYICVCVCACFSDHSNNSKAPVCIYICVCVCVCTEHLPLFETSLVWVYIFLLLYTTLKSVKIMMVWMRWLTDTDVFYHLSHYQKRAVETKDYLKLMRDFTICRN